MNLCKTKLLYLDNMYLYETQAEIIDIKQSDEKLSLILDQTIFYPQSGGQPSDKGTITKNNESEFEVEKVIFGQDVVEHLGTIKRGLFQPKDRVHLKVDQQLRQLHNRYHSAGHLIDYGLMNLGYHLKSVKAYHFPNGAYVEYEGTLDQQVREQLISSLEIAVNKLVQASLPVEVKNYTQHEFSQKVKDIPNVEQWPLRAMSVNYYEPIMCGGTHVTNTSEIGKIIIRKIKNSSGNLRISYEVE